MENMTNQQAYDVWAAIYDTNVNRTRDLEALALQATLTARQFADVLELGCGTGKNTGWLAARCTQLVGLDFSAEMMAQARQKVTADHVTFQTADLRLRWPFADHRFDLVTESLVLEHLVDLPFVFAEAARVLRPNGLFYVGELHPFKQYAGTKARFETATGDTQVLECFTHHVSDFVQAAFAAGFQVADLREWFDEPSEATTAFPRILTLLFQKK